MLSRQKTRLLLSLGFAPGSPYLLALGEVMVSVGGGQGVSACGHLGELGKLGS